MEDEVFDRYAEEERRTFLWRLAEFTRLGFAYPESVVLAGTGIDLAEARKLAQRPAVRLRPLRGFCSRHPPRNKSASEALSLAPIPSSSGSLTAPD